MEKRVYALLFGGLLLAGAFLIFFINLNMTGGITADDLDWNPDYLLNLLNDLYGDQVIDDLFVEDVTAQMEGDGIHFIIIEITKSVLQDYYGHMPMDEDPNLALPFGSLIVDDIQIRVEQGYYKCADSDNGHNLLIKGNCEDTWAGVSLNVSSDTCVNGNQIKEFTCGGAGICVENLTICGEGYSCKSGACVLDETENKVHTACVNEGCVVVEGTGLDECDFDADCGGRGEATPCIDSDGGVSYFERGEVYLNGNLYGEDNCIDDFSLEEIYCEESQAKMTLYNCSLGCNSGRCILEEKISCVDTDEGIDYFEQGSCTYGDNSPITDFCLSDNNLGETYCSNESRCVTQYYTCKYGCLDGVCLEEKKTEEEKEGYFSPTSKRKGLIEIIIEVIKRILEN